MTSDPDTTFSVGSRYTPDAVIVEVVGAIDMLTAPELDQELRINLANDPHLLIIDLTDVVFLASVGLSVLMHTHAEAHHTHVRIVVGDNTISRSIRITGLDSVLTLYRTLDAALVA